MSDSLRKSLSPSGALAAFSAYRRFICYRLEWDGVRGKWQKIPINWHTGETANAHDPAIQIDWDTACTTAEIFGAGYGVGFVFSAIDGFWFLDIDGCLVDGQWSPMAQALLAAFPGAAVEVSVSGNGLHIFGRGVIPEHCCKNIPLHLEFYSDSRFVALTGVNAVGDAGTDHTSSLKWLVDNYFPPSASEIFPWSDSNVPEYEDADLIRRMLASSSNRSDFGNRAAFKDLWEANAEVLGRTYPDSANRAYDASSADMALAQHLAFWTAKDCAQMYRIMLKSKLRREKWDDRPGYVRDTIMKACSRQIDTLTPKEITPPAAATLGAPQAPVAAPAAPPPPPPPDATPATPGAPPPPPPPPPAPAGPPAPIGNPTAVPGPANTFLSGPDQIKYFEGCTWISSIDRIFFKGDLIDQKRFDTLWGGRAFALDTANSKVAKGAWEAFTKSQCVSFPKVSGPTFEPTQEPGKIIYRDGGSYINLWWPAQSRCEPGDASRFTRHLKTMLPHGDDYDILISYIAAVVQYPGVKFQWCPVVQGAEGNGKTWILKVMEYAVGEKYCHRPNSKQLSEQGLKFTGWLAEKILIGIDEIRISNRHATIDSMKPLITNDRIEIERKGVDQYNGINVANIMMFTNHKDAVMVNNDGRRYAVFYTAQQSAKEIIDAGMTTEYLADLWDWSKGENAYAGQIPGWAIMNHFLRTYPIPDKYNPARGCNRAPKTSSMTEAISISMGGIEQAITEAIDSGDQGFLGGFVSSTLLTEMLAGKGSRMSISPHRQKEIMRSLGYVTHPLLPGGRVHNAVAPEGKKSILYIKEGHEALLVSNPAEVGRMYTKAQLPPVAGI